jgi:hypothetical protein
MRRMSSFVIHEVDALTSLLTRQKRRTHVLFIQRSSSSMISADLIGRIVIDDGDEYQTNSGS